MNDLDDETLAAACTVFDRLSEANKTGYVAQHTLDMALQLQRAALELQRNRDSRKRRIVSVRNIVVEACVEYGTGHIATQAELYDTIAARVTDELALDTVRCATEEANTDPAYADRVRRVVQRICVGLFNNYGRVGSDVAAAIAERAAAELATSAPGLDAEDRAALQWAIDYILRTTDHQDGDAGAAIGTIERLRNGAVLPAPDIPAPASAPVLSADERSDLLGMRERESSTKIAIGHLGGGIAEACDRRIALIDRLLGGGK